MAKHKGTAGKTLIGKSLVNLFFGSNQAFDRATKGMQGERRLGRELHKLPDGWRVWHDLDLGGENIDHVVASAKGVFVVEVKNYSGSVLATPKALYTHGNKKPNDDVTRQVWRQVHKLKEQLGGQYIKPLLVFLGEVKGMGRCPVLRVSLVLPSVSLCPTYATKRTCSSTPKLKSFLPRWTG